MGSVRQVSTQCFAPVIVQLISKASGRRAQFQTDAALSEANGSWEKNSRRLGPRGYDVTLTAYGHVRTSSLRPKRLGDQRYWDVLVSLSGLNSTAVEL